MDSNCRVNFSSCLWLKCHANSELYGKKIISFEEAPLMKKVLLAAIAAVVVFAARPAVSADLPMAPVY